MVSSACDFVVHIYQSEIDEIRRNYEEQNQTVGDLFGLWTTSGNVVVHLALSVHGAGEDLESFLKKKYMLCHVGKWQYEANEAPNTKPVGELEQTASETAKRHCARDGYKSRVLLSFRGNQNKDVQAHFILEQGAKSCTATLRILLGTESSGKTSPNPLRNVPAIQKELEERKSVNEINKEDPSGSVSNQVTDEHNGNPITARVIYEGQHVNARPAGSLITQTQQPLSNSGNLFPTNSSTSSQSHASNSAGQQPAAPEFLSSDTGESILEEVLREISLLVQDPQKIDVQRTLATGCLQLKFEIKGKKFEVQFPKAFPEVSAKIFFDSPKQPCQFNLNKKFSTSKSILAALKSCSDLFNPQPSTNQTTTACIRPVGTSPTKVAQVVSRKLDDPEVVALMTLSEKVCIKVNDTFQIAGAVNVQIKEDRPGKRAELTFEHYQKTYLFAIPVEFPKKPARIFYSSYSIRKMIEVVPKSRWPLNNLSKILNAVKYECTCPKCIRTRN